MTLCESVRLYVAGKRSFGGCGFRSGCPVVSAHGCDTVNHAAITHGRRRLHGHNTHTHTHRLAYAIRDIHVYVCFLVLSKRARLFFLSLDLVT